MISEQRRIAEPDVAVGLGHRGGELEQLVVAVPEGAEVHAHSRAGVELGDRHAGRCASDGDRSVADLLAVGALGIDRSGRPPSCSARPRSPTSPLLRRWPTAGSCRRRRRRAGSPASRPVAARTVGEGWPRSTAPPARAAALSLAPASSSAARCCCWTRAAAGGLARRRRAGDSERDQAEQGECGDRAHPLGPPVSSVTASGTRPPKASRSSSMISMISGNASPCRPVALTPVSIADWRRLCPSLISTLPSRLLTARASA